MSVKKFIILRILLKYLPIDNCNDDNHCPAVYLRINPRAMHARYVGETLRPFVRDIREHCVHASLAMRGGTHPHIENIQHSDSVAARLHHDLNEPLKHHYPHQMNTFINTI